MIQAATEKVRVEIDSLTPAEWASTAKGFLDDSLYQSWEFAQSRAAETGTECTHVVIRTTDIIAATQVRIKRLPVIGGGLAYIFRGPMWRRAEGEVANLGFALSALIEEFVDRRRFALRIAPGLHSADPQYQEVLDTIRNAGFQFDSEATPELTNVLDLTPDLTTLRKQLAQKWRNGLNQAERQALHVTAGSDSDAWKEFQRLYDEMWSQKRFETGVSVNEFGNVQTQLPESRRMRIQLAWFEGRAVAGHVSSTLGDTSIYLLGASTEEGRDRKAAYLLQWKAIEYAKGASARWYDLGGIDTVQNPGVYHFKKGMGGTDVAFVPTIELRPRGPARLLVPAAEKVYRLLRRS